MEDRQQIAEKSSQEVRFTWGGRQYRVAQADGMLYDLVETAGIETIKDAIAQVAIAFKQHAPGRKGQKRATMEVMEYLFTWFAWLDCNLAEVGTEGS
jgi:hypothetical protein